MIENSHLARRFGLLCCALIMSTSAAAQSLPYLSKNWYSASEIRPTSFTVVCDPVMAGSLVYMLAGGANSNELPWGAPLCSVPDSIYAIPQADPIHALVASLGFSGTDPASGTTFEFMGYVEANGRTRFRFQPQGGFLANGQLMYVQPVVLYAGCAWRAATATTVAMNGGTGPGGSYTGPADVVPPTDPFPGMGPTAGPSGSGGFCGITDLSQEHLGCYDAITVNASNVFSGTIAFGCVNGQGVASEVTWSQLNFAANQAIAQGLRYVDVLWETFDPLEKIWIYPTAPMQQYGIDWLAIRTTGDFETPCLTTPAQVCNQIVGSQAYTGPYGTQHGFFFGSCAGNLSPAWGAGRACLVDQDCGDATIQTGLRLRFRADCLKLILQQIQASDPGTLYANVAMLSLSGNYCL